MLVGDCRGCTERFARNTPRFRRRGGDREDEWVRRIWPILSMSWRDNMCVLEEEDVVVLLLRLFWNREAECVAYPLVRVFDKYNSNIGLLTYVFPRICCPRDNFVCLGVSRLDMVLCKLNRELLAQRNHHRNLLHL